MIREATEGLAQALDSYVLYLRKQNKKMKIHHSAPAAEVADKTSVTLLQANPAPLKSVHKLNAAISEKGPYELVSVADLAPSDRQEKYLYVQELRKGLCRSCVLCTNSIGGPVGNYLFVWPIPEHVTLEAALSENQKVISQIQSDVPVYHRRKEEKETYC